MDERIGYKHGGRKGEYTHVKRSELDGIWSFVERNSRMMVALVLVLAFIISNLTVFTVTKRRTEARLAAAYRAELQQELSRTRTEVENEMRERYGADELDAEAAHFESEVQLVSKLVYPYLVNVTNNSIRSIVWCVLCRVINGQYPDTIEGVVRQERQWIGFSDDNQVVQRAEEIVREMLTLYYSGKPRPMDPKYVFMNWENGEVILRDAYNGRYHIWTDEDWEALGYT